MFVGKNRKHPWVGYNSFPSGGRAGESEVQSQALLFESQHHPQLCDLGWIT